MKKCGKCGVIKPISEFYIRKDGKPMWACKECNKKLVKKWNKENFSPKTKESLSNENIPIVAGYKCYILNRTKQGEFKYNIVSTSGDVINTNDKNEFMEYLMKNT